MHLSRYVFLLWLEKKIHVSMQWCISNPTFLHLFFLSPVNIICFQSDTCCDSKKSKSTQMGKKVVFFMVTQWIIIYHLKQTINNKQYALLWLINNAKFNEILLWFFHPAPTFHSTIALSRSCEKNQASIWGTSRFCSLMLTHVTVKSSTAFFFPILRKVSLPTASFMPSLCIDSKNVLSE